MSVSHFLRNTYTRWLIEKHEPLVVAVSGGADSLALLHALHADGFSALHAATLDHGLRGTDGTADAEYVRHIAQSWGIAVTVGQAHLDPNIPAVEARARQARYAFLAQVAETIGARKVLTAHHADDQAETVLMHLLRGSGLHGLRGMDFNAPLPTAPHLRLIRPLLHVPRAQIIAYCATHGLHPREDLTNTDTAYLRNRLRLEILPQLATINPQIAQTLAQFARIAAHDDDFLDTAVRQHTEPHQIIGDARHTLPADVFIGLHPALKHRWILLAARALNPNADIRGERVEAAALLAAGGRVGALAELGSGLRLRVDYARIIIETLTAPPDTAGYILMPAHTEIPLTLTSGAQVLDTHTLQFYTSPPPHGFAAHLRIREGAQLTLRTRRSGDRFALSGLGEGHQSIKEWMIDHKVPRHLRDRIPLLCIDGEIAVILVGTRWPTGRNQTIEAGYDLYINFHEKLGL